MPSDWRCQSSIQHLRQLDPSHCSDLQRLGYPLVELTSWSTIGPRCQLFDPHLYPPAAYGSSITRAIWCVAIFIIHRPRVPPVRVGQVGQFFTWCHFEVRKEPTESCSNRHMRHGQGVVLVIYIIVILYS